MSIFATLKRRKRRFFKSLLLGVSVSLLTSFASYMGYLQGIEAKALDLLMWLRGTVNSPQIVLVQIDDKAFENLGEKQPLPRAYLPSLISLVARGGAKVIALDIELKVPTNPDEDAALLNTVHSTSESGISRVVPVYVIRPNQEENDRMLYRRTQFFSPKLNVVAGFANAPMDSDGIVRQVPLAVRSSDGQILPSLALAVLARHAGYDGAKLQQALNQRDNITLLLPEWNKFQGRLTQRLTPFAFQVDDVWKINFAGRPGSFKAIPSDPLFARSKANTPLAADNPFRNKIVLIGATFGDSRDFFLTPQGLMSGIEIHANIIHTLLSRLQILPTDRLIALVITLLFAVLISLLLTLVSPSAINVISVVAVPVLVIPSYMAFVYLGLWVDCVTPLLAIRLGAYLGEFFESRHIRKSLGEFVDREVADQIIDQEESLRGERRDVSVFFTDVRNYTTLCEGAPPEKVVASLNQLFAMMGKVVARHNGCIVDFVGDAVLVVFGAPKENPNHARDAVQTAIEVQEELNALNEKWLKRGMATMEIGVGVHSGEVQAGIVGTGERKKFGITGDTVNTGSRVEGLNKEFSTTILITRETMDRVNGMFDVRRCAEVKVKGREQPVEVFEVLGVGTSHHRVKEVS